MRYGNKKVKFGFAGEHRFLLPDHQEHVASRQTGTKVPQQEIWELRLSLDTQHWLKAVSTDHPI